MNILAFAASNSKKSINKQLIIYASKLIDFANNIEIIDLNDYELAIYSPEREEKLISSGGVPKKAKDFYSKIGQADVLIISFAEHNGSYTAAYKNIFDWMSRIDAKVYQEKPVIMLSASPGSKGASSVLKSAIDSADYFGAKLLGSLSIPDFNKNFDINTHKLTNKELINKLNNLLEKLQIR